MKISFWRAVPEVDTLCSKVSFNLPKKKQSVFLSAADEEEDANGCVTGIRRATR
jgi:hypothetical protein